MSLNPPPFTEMMWLCKYFPHVSEMQIVEYNQVNSIVVKNGKS